MCRCSTQQCSMGTYCHAYWKYTGSLRNTDTSIIRTSSGGLMVSAIEGFHCTLHFQSTYHCTIAHLHAYTHCKLKWEKSICTRLLNTSPTHFQCTSYLHIQMLIQTPFSDSLIIVFNTVISLH